MLHTVSRPCSQYIALFNLTLTGHHDWCSKTEHCSVTVIIQTIKLLLGIDWLLGLLVVYHLLILFVLLQCLGRGTIRILGDWRFFFFKYLSGKMWEINK